jgi:hypothetical protein
VVWVAAVQVQLQVAETELMALVVAVVAHLNQVLVKLLLVMVDQELLLFVTHPLLNVAPAVQLHPIPMLA